MAISITCSACGKRYNAADHMAGRRVRCKHCGTTFQLPATPTSSEPFEPFQDADAPIPMEGGGGAVLDDAYATDPPAVVTAPIASRHQHQQAPPPDDSPFGDESSSSPFDAAGNPRETGGGEDDVEAVFEGAFQQYYPARGNTPFIFPGSLFLDRWLSTILVVACVAWLAYLSISSADGDPLWVPIVRLIILLGTYSAVVFPICLIGARKAARTLNYDLPSGVRFRAYATFLLPVTIGCAVWLSSDSVPGFIFGVAMGLIVALPVMWLLFRIRGDDAPVSMGYGAAALGGSVLAAAVALTLLDLLIMMILRSASVEPTLSMSPFGPGFPWDIKPPPPEMVARSKPSTRPAAPANEPVELTTKAFVAGPDDTAPGATTRPVEKPPEDVVAVKDPPPSPPPPTDPANPDDPTIAPAEPPDLTSQNPAVKKIAHGPIVAEVNERLSGEMRAIVYPVLPGRAIAAVRKSNREDEDLIEVWDTADWTKQKSGHFARAVNETESYQLTAEGNYLARLTEFPYLSIQVYSFESGETLRPYIKLEAAAPRPRVAGFCAPDQLILLNEKAEKPNFEVREVAALRRKHTDVPGLRADTGSFALSRDGKLLALLIRDGSSGRIEVYSTITGKPTRRIVIDELQWNNEVKPAGVDFNQAADRIAVLFEHRGQGLFLCWGNDNDVPTHLHLYPGGLVAEGINTAAFRGKSFALIDDGRAFVLYGASVFDTITGKLLGQIAISNVTSQNVLTPDKLLLTQQADGQTSLLEARLDLKGARKELAAKE